MTEFHWSSLELIQHNQAGDHCARCLLSWPCPWIRQYEHMAASGKAVDALAMALKTQAAKQAPPRTDTRPLSKLELDLKYHRHPGFEKEV